MRMTDLPTDFSVTMPDERGHFGPYGGVFVAETLMRALDELKAAYARYRDDPAFRAEFERELKHYVGRPSPVYHAERWSPELGGAQIWLKREDLNHTGAHKINNVIGQALLAKRMGKPRVIAETGAGQHGVATATIAARYGMECIVYMGSEDVKRQAQNVYRMNLLGAKVVPVESGSKTLKDALNEGDARLGDERREHLLHHRHRRGTASVPDDGARFPARDRRRMRDADARVRGPSSRTRSSRASAAAATRWASSIRTSRFQSVRLIGVEAGGDGLATGRHAALSPAGDPACCTATAPTSCRMRTGRSSRRTPCRPASTIRASAPSTRGSRTPSARNTS
jgi:tryptophan synthase beta chain